MTSVRDWYANKNILITGATGFMGKVLVEKLLRSCPELRSIYIIVRPKKGQNPSQRLTDFVKVPLFDKLRNRPDARDIFAKLYVVSGDLIQPNLDLKPEDAELLINNVNAVFHIAAEVRFDQPLKEAATLNIGGTMKVLDFCCTMENLEAFVHVSTTYCHCEETILEERMYTATHKPREILDMVTWMDEDLLNWLTPKLLGNSPNTYSYTKSLAEQLVAEYSNKIPVLIARPSIVTAVWKEPLPGWIDNINGPTGVLAAAGKGVLRTMQCNSGVNAYPVPVDVAINSLVILAWKLATSSRKEEPLVYNITVDETNSLTWDVGLETATKHVHENPFSGMLWYPSGFKTSSYTVYFISSFLLHTIPAYIIDVLATLSGNKPFMVNIQNRIHKGLKVMQYFTTRPWYFHSEKLKELRHQLSDVERDEFYIDSENINWDDYIKDYVLGCRVYCLRDNLDTLPQARKVLKRMYYLDAAVKIAVSVLFLWYFLNIFIKLVL